MSDISFVSPTINLETYQIRSLKAERYAVLELQRQIIKYLEESGLKRQILKHPAQSLILNKLVYFSSKEFPDLKITRGWYKYGPCYELGRKSEESLSLEVFKSLELNKDTKVSDQVKRICDRELKEFLSSKQTGIPFDYLNHVYSICDYEKLKSFYITKNTLSKLLFNLINSTETKDILIEKLIENTINFDRVITNSKYYGIINMSESELDIILDYTAILSNLAHEYIEDESRRTELTPLIKKYTKFFMDVVLLIFAYKNYGYSIEARNDKTKQKIKEIANESYDKLYKNTVNMVEYYYTKEGR